MPSKIVAKAAIINASGQILLLRRSATDPRRPGEWDFPGGGIEDGEDLVAGVAREIQEEAGMTLAVAQLRLIYAATEPYDNGESVTRLLFTGRVGSNDVQLSFEHDGFRWVTLDEALVDFPHPFYGAGLQYGRDHGLLPFD